MADISIDQIKQIVGGLYLENAALKAQLAAQPVFEVVGSDEPTPAATDDITGHKRPPLRDINSA